jgi:hypothetical protein
MKIFSFWIRKDESVSLSMCHINVAEEIEQEPIQVYGLKCKKTFNKLYGSEIAHGYIEIYYTKSINESEGRLLNPETVDNWKLL